MFGGFYECSITLIDCCFSSQIRCKPWDINIIIKKKLQENLLEFLSHIFQYLRNIS